MQRQKSAEAIVGNLRIAEGLNHRASKGSIFSTGMVLLKSRKEGQESEVAGSHGTGGHATSEVGVGG